MKKKTYDYNNDEKENKREIKTVKPRQPPTQKLEDMQWMNLRFRTVSIGVSLVLVGQLITNTLYNFTQLYITHTQRSRRLFARS